MPSRIACACAVAFLTFAAASAREEKVSLGHVPKPVMDAVKTRFPQGKPTEAARETEEGRPVYEVSLQEAGHNVDVTLTPEGTLLLIERTIPGTGLPDPVRQALEHAYPGASYRTVEEIVEVDHGQERLASYEVVLVRSGGGKREVKVTADGATVTEEED